MTAQGNPGPPPDATLRVLVAWQLGANLGHLLRMESISVALRARGHEVIWAVPDPDDAQAKLSRGPWSMLRIPRPAARPEGRTCCYAEILAAHGFGDDDTLAEAMRDWTRLLALVKPDVMIIDHAPLALLAARLHGVPAAHIATGWEAPPFGVTLPVLRPEMAQTRPGFVKTLESQLLSRINRLCREQGAPELPTLGELYRAQMTLIDGWAETDHFAPRPDRAWFAPGDPRRKPFYVGPLFSVDAGDEPQWPSGGGPRVFVYMQPGDSTHATLQALNAMDLQVIAAVPGITTSGRALVSTSRCLVHDRPVRLRKILDEADLVVCHGGHGLVAASLMAGTPLVLVPSQMEQATLAGRVVQTHAALMVEPVDFVPRFAAAVHAALSDPRFRAAAQRISQKYRGFDPDIAVKRVAATIEDMGWCLTPRHAVDAVTQ